jgi:hypothetical protein
MDRSRSRRPVATTASLVVTRGYGGGQQCMRPRPGLAAEPAARWQQVPTIGRLHSQASATEPSRSRPRSAVRYRPSGLGMGKLLVLLVRLARNFRRKFVTRWLVAVCFVLRGRNWNSATLAVLNQHLAITRQIQTLRHAIPPMCSAVQILETGRECERFHSPGPTTGG